MHSPRNYTKRQILDTLDLAIGTAVKEHRNKRFLLWVIEALAAAVIIAAIIGSTIYSALTLNPASTVAIAMAVTCVGAITLFFGFLKIVDYLELRTQRLTELRELRHSVENVLRYITSDRVINISNLHIMEDDQITLLTNTLTKFFRPTIQARSPSTTIISVQPRTAPQVELTSLEPASRIPTAVASF